MSGPSSLRQLTMAEKLSGRAFRSRCQASLDQVEATGRCSPFSVWFRHDCRGVSWAMRLHQRASVSYDGTFTFIYRFGECPKCAMTVRSGTGRLVLTERVTLEKGALRAHWPEDGHLPEG